MTALISRVCREQDIAVLMVAHDVNPLLPYLDLVAYVGAERIVSGEPEEVITTETLSRLYGTGSTSCEPPTGGSRCSASRRRAPRAIDACA